MARTALVVNDVLREKVRHLAGLGVPQHDIAKIIGCAAKTLRRHFRDELDRGVAEANATISGSLFGAAKGGNVTAQIFWLKTRARWREGLAADDSVPSADAGSNSEVILTLPDNNRDPELTQVLRHVPMMADRNLLIGGADGDDAGTSRRDRCHVIEAPGRKVLSVVGPLARFHRL